jgi:hypothetical protein
LVVHLYLASPYAAVKAAASTALQAPAQRREQAIAEFLPVGWCAATQRANEDLNVMNHVIQRVLTTHTYAISPRVYSAAEAARDGSLAQKEAFVRGGLEEARAADQRARDEDRKHVEELRDFDRNYVAELASTAQGEQVKKAAAYAVHRESSDPARDRDIVEFFAYAWARFAKLDLEQFQLKIADQEMRWLAETANLREVALQAQKEAETASGEAQKALNLQAADAWAKIANGAGTSASNWLQAKEAADAQVRQWKAVYQLALKLGGPNWKAMSTPSRANRDGWDRDSRNARDRAAVWEKVVADALAREEALRSSNI